MVTSRPDAGWYRDPSGRHEHRWWSGTEWTPHVLTLGLRSIDFGADQPEKTVSAATAVAASEDRASTTDRSASAEVESTEAETGASVAPRRPVAAWSVVLAGAALLVAGALLPWAEATSKSASFSRDGIDGDGAITLVAGVVLALVLLVERTKLAAGLVLLTAGIAGAIGVRDAVDVSQKATRLVERGPSGVSAGTGLGIWVTIAGAAIALVGGIVLLAVASRRRRTVAP